jgi:hypothetical protein
MALEEVLKKILGGGTPPPPGQSPNKSKFGDRTKDLTEDGWGLLNQILDSLESEAEKGK